MSMANDFLDLAKKLVRYQKADVLRARLRRAISTAYYAIFHLLLENGSAKIVSHPQIRILVGRAYTHSEMVKTAKSFQSGANSLPAHLTAPFGGTLPALPVELTRVAKAFVILQEARHAADYDSSKSFTRGDAKVFVSHASDAFTDWNTVVSMPIHHDVCELFLAAMLLGDRLKK